MLIIFAIKDQGDIFRLCTLSFSLTKCLGFRAWRKLNGCRFCALACNQSMERIGKIPYSLFVVSQFWDVVLVNLCQVVVKSGYV